MAGEVDRHPEHAEDAAADHPADRHRARLAQPEQAAAALAPRFAARVIGRLRRRPSLSRPPRSIDIVRDSGDEAAAGAALRPRRLARGAALGDGGGRDPRRAAGRRRADPAGADAGPRPRVRRRGGGGDAARPLRADDLRRRLRPGLAAPRAGRQRPLRLGRVPRRGGAARPGPPARPAGAGAGRRQLRPRPLPPPRPARRAGADRRAALVGPAGPRPRRGGDGAGADRRRRLARPRPQRPAGAVPGDRQRPRRLHPPARRRPTR